MRGSPRRTEPPLKTLLRPSAAPDPNYPVVCSMCRALVESLPAVTYVANVAPGHHFLYVSPQVERMLGYRPEDLLERRVVWPDLVHPDDRRRLSPAMERFAREEGPFTAEYRVIARDGRAVTVRDEASVVRDETGKPLLLQGFFLDVSESREQEAALSAAREALARARRLGDLGKLSARVVHDLRNPLQVIRFAAANLRRALGGRATPPMERSLGNIEKKILECESILGSLLGYTRLRPPRRRRFVFRRLVDECVKEARARHPSVRIERVKPAGEAPILAADRQQIKEIIDNLIDNACDAVAGREGRVVVACRRQEENVVLVIRDDGPGIAPEDLKRVFEPFFTRKKSGTGLGLSICRDIVEWHGGRVSIASRPGEGTAVTVVLPLEGRKG